MKVIYKYPVPVSGDDVTVRLPAFAKVLCVQVQGDEPHIWVFLNPNSASDKPRVFRWYGTAHRITNAAAQDASSYVGTIQQAGGRLVWHLFEVTP